MNQELSQGGKVKRYGLIAGWGKYPIMLAKAIKASGHEVVCLGVLNHADPVLAEICDVFDYDGLAKFGHACRFFRRHGVEEATMAGKIFKNLLLQPGFIFRQLPDFYTIRVFAPVFFGKKSDLNNDTLLLAATNAFERKGVHLLPGTDLAPELLVGRKRLTRLSPTPEEWADIRYAWPIARELGRLDIGQVVAVKNRVCLAIEGIEGTDETAKRASSLNRDRGYTLVKVGKPNQDMRFDVPTFGFETLKTMVRTGANVLAIEADRSIFIEPQDELIAFADENNIAIVSIDEADLAQESFPLQEGV